MAEQNSIIHYPVDNGDMTLIQSGSKGLGKTILVDMKVRSTDGNSSIYDIPSDLYKHLPINSNGAPYIDLFVLTHPDDDHCLGFKKYMHTGDPDNWKSPDDDEKPKIILNEIWFSEICTKRVSKDLRLSDDAKAFRTEAKRRRALYEGKLDGYANAGNQLKVIGIEEESSDTKENWYLDGMTFKRGEEIAVGNAKALILGPFGDEIFGEEHSKDKNGSSVIIRWTVNNTHILLGGDATAHIWKHIWNERKDEVSQLQYDLMVAPHHCSWRSLSYESASKNTNPKVLPEALAALSQAHNGAYIVSSSEKIKADKPDPPSHLAKNEYLKILNNQSSKFICLADTGTNSKPPKPRKFTLSAGVVLAAIPITTSSFPHSKKPIRHG